MSADSTQAGVKRSSRPSLDGPEGQAKKTRRAQPSPPGSFRLPNAPPAAETPTLQDDSTPMEPTRQDTQPVESYQTNLAATDTLAQAGSGVEPLEDEPVGAFSRRKPPTNLTLLRSLSSYGSKVSWRIEDKWSNRWRLPPTHRESPL